MARRISRGGVIRSGPRRATKWIASADIDAEASLAASASVLTQTLSAASLVNTLPATIVRTRGILWVSSDQEAQDEEPFGALGFAVVSEQARATGITAVPTPITDEGSDLWFVHQYWQADMSFISASGYTTNGFKAYEFDSKAMRKVQDGDSVAVVMENANASFGCTFILKFRMLFKLH